MEAYPVFEELEIEDSILFKQAFSSNPPKISEFTFTNLYAWRHAYKLKACRLGGFIILRSDSEPQIRFFDPIGRGDKAKAVEKILQDSKAIFIRLPEETIVSFADQARLRIEPDTDNADYLYKLESLVSLGGRKYDGKRNLIKKFQAANTYEYITMDSANVEECLEFEERWCAIRNCDRIEGLSKERQAIREMVKNFSNFELIGGAIKIQGNYSAVALAEKLNPDTLVMHVLKADPNIGGLYQAVLWEFLSRQAGGFTYVNLEQDLGQPGLRKAKQSYHPLGMIKKYTLTLIN